MAQTLPDITATSDDWVSINTLSGIPVGETFTVTNKSSFLVLLHESSAKPAAGNLSGSVLTNLTGTQPSAVIPFGELEVWAKSLNGSAVLSITQSGIRTASVVPIEVSDRGSIALPVFVQDQTTNPLSVPLLRTLNTTTLTATGAIGDTEVALTAGHGTVVGNTLQISDPTSGLFLQAQVLAVVVNDVTLDQPLNFAYSTTDPVVISDNSMLVVGTLTAPIIFSVLPLSTHAGDMLKLIIDIRSGSDMDFSTFGSETALVNGCVVRVLQNDGNFRNLFNFKSNGDFIHQGFDHQFLLPKGGNTIRGFTSKVTWGVRLIMVLRLD